MKKSVKKSKKPSRLKSKELYPQKLKSIIEASVDRYIKVLGMNHYRTRIYYMKSDIIQDDNRMSQESSVAATATVDMRYLRLIIRVYPYVAVSWVNKRMNDEEVEEVIAHEVAHLATNHLYTVATATYRDSGEMGDAWESLSTLVGRFIHEIGETRRKKEKKHEK